MTTTETTKVRQTIINVFDGPEYATRYWAGKEAMKRLLREFLPKANVQVSFYRGDDRDDDRDGLKITHEGVDELLTDEKLDEFLLLANQATKEKEEEEEAKKAKFVEDFEFRDLSKVEPKDQYQEVIRRTLVELQDSAREQLVVDIEEENDAYLTLFDFPAYYKVLDVAMSGADWETILKAVQNNDTAVRERFEDFYQLLESEGKH